MEKNLNTDTLLQTKLQFLCKLEKLSLENSNNKFFTINEIADLATVYNYVQSTKTKSVSHVKPLILAIHQYSSKK